jgi:hypothetical protein
MNLLMDKTLTHEDLLLFAYGDFKDSIHEHDISELIRHDNVLYNEYLEITDLKQMIEKSFGNPSDKVINRIISYSKALADVDVEEPSLRSMIQN